MAKKFSVIKSDENIRQAIIKRLEELNKSQQDVVRDAALLGYKIPSDMLNRYLKQGDSRGTLREEQIVWLALRYGIYLTLKIGKPVVNELGKVSYEISPYNEAEALGVLRKIFKTK